MVMVAIVYYFLMSIIGMLEYYKLAQGGEENGFD
jgi:hypothetical protein